jgi:hypothetical protein
MMNSGFRGAWSYAVLTSGVVILSAGIDIFRFGYFLRASPSHAMEGSIASQLAYQRILSITVPNVATNFIISIGGLVCLMLRDWKLAISVICWAGGSYILQSRIAQNVYTDARGLRDDGNSSDIAISTQSRLLRWQVISGLLNSVLKIIGQIAIYSLCFALVISSRGKLPLETLIPRAMANLEYVGLTLAGLQIVFSSLPQLREAAVYAADNTHQQHNN